MINNPNNRQAVAANILKCLGQDIDIIKGGPGSGLHAVYLKTMKWGTKVHKVHGLHIRTHTTKQEAEKDAKQLNSYDGGDNYHVKPINEKDKLESISLPSVSSKIKKDPHQEKLDYIAIEILESDEMWKLITNKGKPNKSFVSKYCKSKNITNSKEVKYIYDMVKMELDDSK